MAGCLDSQCPSRPLRWPATSPSAHRRPPKSAAAARKLLTPAACWSALRSPYRTWGSGGLWTPNSGKNASPSSRAPAGIALACKLESFSKRSHMSSNMTTRAAMPMTRLYQAAVGCTGQPPGSREGAVAVRRQPVGPCSPQWNKLHSCLPWGRGSEYRPPERQRRRWWEGCWPEPEFTPGGLTGFTCAGLYG